jgi:hypothetical protein
MTVPQAARQQSDLVGFMAVGAAHLESTMRHFILCLLILSIAVLKAPAQEGKDFFAPKKLRLKFVDAQPAEVIGELSKQSGYPIIMEKYLPLPVKPLVTIDTGEMTFWQAFDEVCAKANLQLIDIHFGEAANLAQVMPPEQLAKYQDVRKRIFANDEVLFGNTKSPAYKAALELHPKLLLEEAKCAPKTHDLLVRKPTVLLLRQAEPEKVPSLYSGPFRFRVVVCETGAQLNLQPEFAGELIVVVELTAEPRFQDLQLMDVKVGKSDFPQVLDQKRPLDFSNINNRRGFAQEHGTDIQRHLYFRFRSGEMVKELRELAGSLKAQTFARLAELSLKNPLEAAGKSIDLGKRGKLEIKSVDKENDGYCVRYSTKFSNQVTLLDDKNQAYAKRFKKNGDVLFLPERGQGEPHRLVVFEPETETTETAFRFENIPVKRLLDKKTK